MRYLPFRAYRGDRLIEKNCSTCEFNFGVVCASHGVRLDNGLDTYGMSIDLSCDMFPNGCDEWEISFESFVDQEKMNGR